VVDELVLPISGGDFCALGREKIFAGLRQIFRCPARRFRLYYRHCKGTNFSAIPQGFSDFISVLFQMLKSALTPSLPNALTLGFSVHLT
jgi:hypothetical protein